ncbi:MAG: rhamnosidase [Armatimonadetes bacterium]|nr:MAG: rhamnosidase [Armatimonadota bacterium]
MMPWVFLAMINDPIAPPDALIPTHLTCEYQIDPKGIGAREPLLSWQIVSSNPNARNQFPTAYRVLVASERELLDMGRGDLWDSGKVDSADSRYVRWGGQPLPSRQRAFWKVRIWDQDGVEQPWSTDASFSVGLLEKSDWQAEWIGHDAPIAESREMPDFEGALWIGHESEVKGEQPMATRAFRHELSLNPSEVSQAWLLVTGDDEFDAYLNGRLVAKSDQRPHSWTRPETVDVTPLLRPGRNVIAVRIRNTLSGWAGLLGKLLLARKDGSKLESTTGPDWKCADGWDDRWADPSFDDSAWPQAKTLGEYGDSPWGRVPPRGMFLPPPRYLRRGFQIEKPISHATLHATALGVYEARINGKRVAEALFLPGWTDYNLRIPTHSFDVTGLLQQGENVWSVLLADGWFAGYVGYGGQRNHYGDALRFLGQLEIEYEDGTKKTVATGPDWRASTGGLREADFLMGETFDSSAEPWGWDARGFEEKDWQPVEIGSAIQPRLEPAKHQPVAVIARFEPLSVSQVGPDAYVLDLGQNIAGYAQLELTAERGREITLRYAERLDAEGKLYTTNLRGARAVDKYVCRGEGIERWSPRFTFHGFQFIEVSGLGRAPRRGEVVGLAIASDTPITGHFECSDPMLNRLAKNIYWTQRMNFLEVPTDCPQRDERLGWTGDAQVYATTAAYFADVEAFFDKWLIDLTDAQRADGQFPMVAPLKVAGPDGGPAWADAGVIVPWELYRMTGNVSLLRRQFPSMLRFVEFSFVRCGEGTLPPKEFHCFGDWLNIDDPTPNEVLFLAYLVRSADFAAEAADVLGKADNSRRLRDIAAAARTSFQKNYVDSDGRIAGDSQTAYALAIDFGLLPQAGEARTAQHLVRKLEERGVHLSTGFVGTKPLMRSLAKVGRFDLAYRLLQSKEFPSWGFTIEHGATSIWERWNGWTPEEGFADPGMNSFAHYAFGAVGEWMMEHVAGIAPRSPGFAQILIHPKPGGTLTSVRASHHSPYGPIRVEWSLEGRRFELTAEIPPGVRAVVRVPSSDPSSVLEESESGWKAVAGKAGAGYSEIEVGSGTYRWKSTESSSEGGPTQMPL